MVLGSDVKVDQAILCEDVRVGAKAVIPRGCVISRGVVIAPDTVLPEFTRVFRNLPDNQVSDCFRSGLVSLLPLYMDCGLQLLITLKHCTEF